MFRSQMKNSLVAIYPNPVRTFTIINSKEEGKLFIYNDSGKLTINKILLKGENIIYLTSLSPGVYHFLIKLKSKTIEKNNNNRVRHNTIKYLMQIQIHYRTSIITKTIKRSINGRFIVYIFRQGYLLQKI